VLLAPFLGFAPERLPTAAAALSSAIKSEIVKAAREQRYGLFNERSVPEAVKATRWRPSRPSTSIHSSAA
jgi:hypothetical protein